MDRERIIIPRIHEKELSDMLGALSRIDHKVSTGSEMSLEVDLDEGKIIATIFPKSGYSIREEF